jgi:hypothetical protein
VDALISNLVKQWIWFSSIYVVIHINRNKSKEHSF